MAVTRPSPTDTGPSRITIPRLNKDPIQSLSPYSVVVSVADLDLEIPALPAADWLSVMMVESLNLDDIFPGLLDSTDTDLVEEVILSGTLDLDEYEDVIFDIIETVSARSWWVAIRLIETARTSWDSIGAELTLKGIDATHISLSSWLDALMLTIIRSMDPKDVQMWCMKLEVPPAGVEVAGEEMEMAASDFMSMAN